MTKALAAVSRPIIFLLAMAAVVKANSMYMIEAGTSGKKGPTLENGFSICPTDFSSVGFSIVCDLDASSASFYVDNTFARQERMIPFTIAGDWKGRVFPWRNVPAGTIEIKCEGDSGAEIKVMGSFDCGPASAMEPVNADEITARVKANSMYMIEAGTSGKKGPTLENGFSICPTDFSSVGFSIVCDLDASSASFYVGTSLARTESMKPFTIAGDMNGNVFPWKNVPLGPLDIRCVGGGGAEIKATGKFACDASSSAAETESATKSTATDTEAATEAEPETATEAATETARDAGTESSDAQDEPPAAMEPVGVDEKYCVTIPALSYDKSKPISDDWEELGDGSLSYLPFDDSTGTVGADTAPVIYKFTVPIKSTYGITMDSYAPHPTEHNDIFITFDSITLRRGTTEDSGKRNPLKAYQNKGPSGRSKVASSVDFNPHTFSTTQVLEPGKEYTIIVGARSTQFRLYGLILFPCAGAECIAGKPHWQQYLGICNV